MLGREGRGGGETGRGRGVEGRGAGNKVGQTDARRGTGRSGGAAQFEMGIRVRMRSRKNVNNKSS